MSVVALACIAVVLLASAADAGPGGERPPRILQSQASQGPFVVVLGVAQDGGKPQAGTVEDPAWNDPHLRRRVACLGLVDRRSGSRWMFEATPDFRAQLHALDVRAPRRQGPVLDGIFLTHAHVGHYTGLMFLGHEVMGARDVPVYVMPRMRAFLERNGPWSQLVRLGNIVLRDVGLTRPVRLGDSLVVETLVVPHRQEFSEVVAYRIVGPRRSVLFLPDVDSWKELDDRGTPIEGWIAAVDVAFLDATFFDRGEIPGRDMSTFPHPFMVESLERFAALPQVERRKIHFIHLNHTNPALLPGSPARRRVEAAGCHLAEQGMTVELGS